MCKGCGSSNNLIPPHVGIYDPNAFDPCSEGDCGANPCSDCAQGCKQQIDPECIIYGKNDPTVPELELIGAYVGSNLQEILETINDRVASNNPLDITGIATGYLKQKYELVTFKDLIEAIVQELEELKTPTPTNNSSINHCFSFTIVNTSSSTVSYNKRDCNGVRINNISIAAGSRITVTAQGVWSGSSSVVITNNGVL